MAFAPRLLVLSLLVYFSSAALPTATVSVVSPQGPYYPGDQVTLSCDIAEYTDWHLYYWYSGQQYIQQQNSRTINTVPDQIGQYQFTCEGYRIGIPDKSQHSKPTPVTVTAMPEPTVEISMATVYPGEPVTLTCLIQPSGGWTYGWGHNPWSSHNLGSHGQSDSNSYTIGSAEESNGGHYACYGRRKGSGRQTNYSSTASLTVLALPTATLTVVPQSPVFTGETVTMTCVIESLSGWTYKWYKGSSRVPVSEGNTFTITSAAESDEGQYWCQGWRTGRPTTSHISKGITLDVKVLPAATLTIWPEGPVFTGETVTMMCVIESLGGWTYQWYKEPSRVPVSEGNTFTITSAAESDEGQYWCQGERRQRPKISQSSRSITLDVKESKPQLTLNQNPQLFTRDLVTLTCELGVSSGLMFYWYRDTQTSTPVAQTGGNSYSISSAKVSDGGQYWCRAGRGDPVYYTQYSNEVQLNVTASVILESPVHPVTEGDRLTLRCRYRHQPSNISADFYKEGTLVHTSSTGEMTIPAVSKSHEGLYKCSNPERGESPESWITVMQKMTGSSIAMVAVGVVVGLVMASALVILLLLLYRKRKSTGSTTPNLGQQSSGYNGQQVTASGGAVAGASDAVYADIKPKEKGDKKKKKEKAKTSAAQSDTLYSTLKPSKTADNTEDDGDPNDGSDVTYSEVTIKNKKGKKQGSAGPNDVTYADVHIKMNPLNSTDHHNVADAGSGDATYAQVRKKGKKPDTQDV